MTTRNYGLMRVLWPSDAPRDVIPGVLVGWRNSDLDVLVVGVLQGVEVGEQHMDLEETTADNVSASQCGVCLAHAFTLPWQPTFD